jgi:hypothetical protein
MPTVSYIPNDPLSVGGPPQRKVTAGKFPAGAAKFSVQPTAPAGSYKPHTPQFGYWQTQTALIAGIETWKSIDGKHLPKWFGGQASLPVLTNAGDDLNAFYDRASLQFFSHTFGGTTVYSCESVDVVTHEQGHAILDAIRPDFFDVPFIEVGALHEAFGDCIAILTALSDKAVRDRVVAVSADLSAGHFVEAVAEQLGDAILREFGPGSAEVGALRHALNQFRWVDPTTLPSHVPSDQLSGEVHSFARVFAGAFYDVIRNIYNAGPRTSAGLLAAAQRAGKLLVAAIRTVPAAPRTFEGVGRRMLQADATLNAGANATPIRTAFAAHGMALPAPTASIAVPLERRTRGDGMAELKRRMAVPPDAEVQVTPVDSELHGEIAHVTAFRPLPLTDVLPGVDVKVPASARVTRRGRSITGTIGEVQPATGEVDNEARAFVRALVQSGDVRVPARVARRLQAPPMRGTMPRRTATHEVQIEQGRPTLKRVGFSCRS